MVQVPALRASSGRGPASALERGGGSWRQRAPGRARGGGRAGPSPATHAILTLLKAGESVIQTLVLTKTVVHVYRAQPQFYALFWRQNTV